jgi:hypothetical protein
MEWIQRNPKTAAALAALVLLCVAVLAWGTTRGSDEPRDDPAGAAPLATPTASPTRPPLTALPEGSPTAAATGASTTLAGFPSTGMGAMPGIAGEGFNDSLPRHQVVITAGADSPLAGVAWRIPLAKGARSGTEKSPGTSFSHAAVSYGQPDYAQLYTFVGPDGSHVWCTVTVDGRVTDHQEARGPWGEVFCQG